jgi:hypothetical protein
MKNFKAGVRGYLFRGRFGACILNERRLLASVRYVGLNSMYAGIVGNAWDYSWSSAALHIKRTDVDMLIRDRTICGLIEDWYGYLENDKDIPMEEIRMATRTGQSAGGQYFTEIIAQLICRLLQKGKPGGPRKQKLQENCVMLCHMNNQHSQKESLWGGEIHGFIITNSFWIDTYSFGNYGECLLAGCRKMG